MKKDRTKAHELLEQLKTVIDEIAEEMPEEEKEKVEVPDFSAFRKPPGDRFRGTDDDFYFIDIDANSRTISGQADRAYKNDMRAHRIVTDACLHAIDAWERERGRLYYEWCAFGNEHPEESRKRCLTAEHNGGAWRDAYEQFLKAADASQAKE